MQNNAYLYTNFIMELKLILKEHRDVLDSKQLCGIFKKKDIGENRQPDPPVERKHIQDSPERLETIFAGLAHQKSQKQIPAHSQGRHSGAGNQRRRQLSQVDSAT